MACKRLVETLGIGLLLASAAMSAHAQGVANCQSGAGEPAKVIETYGPLAGSPFEVVAALNSKATSTPFAIQDASGRGIAGQVEITLPDQPAELRFLLDNDINVTRKHAIVNTVSCVGYLPLVVVGPLAGTVNATMRVVGGATTLIVPIRAIAVTYSRFDTSPIGVFAKPGELISGGAYPYATAAWSDGARFGPLAGVPIRFAAPASGPSVQFSNLDPVIVIETDGAGIARAPAVPTAPGVIDVKATYPDGALAQAWRFTVTDVPHVALADGVAEYGASARVSGEVRVEPFDCERIVQVPGLFRDALRFRAGSFDLAGPAVGPSSVCTNGVLRMGISASLVGLPFGSYAITAEIAAGQVTGAATSAPATIVVQPSFTVTSATGRGRIRIGSADPGYIGQTGKCRVRSAEPLVQAGPPGVELPYGALRVELGDCLFGNNSGFPTPLPPSAQQVLLELDEEPAPGTVAWAFGPTGDQATQHWYELPTSITGRFVLFEVVDGSLGDDKVGADQVIRSLVVLGVPRYAAVAGSFQDLWWGGAQENGWGLSLTQHREVLFGALFIYDASGAPRWLVMPGGAWNAERTTFTGSLYRPRGSENHANLPATFDPGSPVGTLRLTPSSRDAMAMSYTIDGTSGSKAIRRQAFGPVHPFPVLRHDDLWWAGVLQNGWGYALAQQYHNYFGVIFTYDAQGMPTWFVAPSLAITPAQEVTGPLYRTRGAPWIGVAYDPATLSVTETGSLRFYFDSARHGIIHARFDERPAIEAGIERQPF